MPLMPNLHASDLDHAVITPLHLVNRRAHATWVVPEGKWPFHNMMLVLSGKGICQVDGKPYPMEAGQLFYHPVDHSFGYLTSSDEPLHCIGGNIAIHSLRPGELANPSPQLAPIDSLPLDRCFTPANLPVLTRWFGELVACWNEHAPERIMRCRAILLRIVEDLLRDRRKVEQGDEKLLQVAAYLRSHYASKHRLSDLAKMADLAPSYFGQKFKALTGESPIDYLNTIRIEQTLLQLAQGHTIQQAATRCGFNDPFYFTRMFKLKKGMSPSAYLNRGHWML